MIASWLRRFQTSPCNSMLSTLHLFSIDPFCGLLNLMQQVVMLLHRLGNDSPSDVCCYCGGGIIKASGFAATPSLCPSHLKSLCNPVPWTSVETQTLQWFDKFCSSWHIMALLIPGMLTEAPLCFRNAMPPAERSCSMRWAMSSGHLSKWILHSWHGFERKWQRTAFQTVFIYPCIFYVISSDTVANNSNVNDKDPETASSVFTSWTSFCQVFRILNQVSSAHLPLRICEVRLWCDVRRDAPVAKGKTNRTN